MNELKIHRVYKHFKGDYYLVEDVALDSETKQEMVVYRRLYGEGNLWVRPKEMFLSEVDHEKYPQVRQKYRFEKIFTVPLRLIHDAVDMVNGMHDVLFRIHELVTM